ncbi:related to Dynactin 6 [Sporisorium reilianum SRZ2]|uniref:Dynactin subunit 6 n=1 Tax=Sporisorium reilianum (strain SRZ2) TaxID=999809 RepID=E7A2M0_SPORE|nr:related to Dynactin 6 [Sporisorium reilianum SRZ2]
MAPLRDNLTVGTRVVIAQDADLRGEISVGSGTVIHPKATILALQGPISIGSNCIIEETAVIVNRRSAPIRIGDNNLFEVGCRIEAASIGSYNVFEVRSKVASNVAIGSYSVVGAGCTVLPKPISDDQLAGIFDEDEDGNQRESEAVEGEDAAAESGPISKTAREEQVFEQLPDQTVVYGADSRRRLWSGEGAQQQAALHAKHLEYLRDAIPRVHKLKIIQGVRAPASAAAPASAGGASTASST